MTDIEIIRDYIDKGADYFEENVLMILAKDYLARKESEQIKQYPISKHDDNYPPKKRTGGEIQMSAYNFIVLLTGLESDIKSKVKSNTLHSNEIDKVIEKLFVEFKNNIERVRTDE